MDEIKRTIQICVKVEAYEGFFDEEWKQSFLKLVGRSKLREPGYDLIRNWEGASNARQIPWLMVRCVDEVLCKKIEELEPPDCRRIRMMRDKLIDKLQRKGEEIRHMFRKRLQAAMEEIDQEASQARDAARDQVLSGREDLWEVLIKEESFYTSLWSSERMCYGALYYSYECFLRECVRINRGEDTKEKRLKDDFRDAFGQDLANACWSDKKIHIARLTRNALVHNGGRITSQLEKQPHNFRVEDGEIQIGAPNTTDLYKLLKERAYQLAESCVKTREFNVN